MVVVSFLLVDPDLPACDVPSTSNVAPQAVSWIRTGLEASVGDRIPPELIDKIMEEVILDDWSLSEEESERLAEEVQEEREVFRRNSESNYFSVSFDAWNGPYLQ